MSRSHIIASVLFIVFALNFCFVLSFRNDWSRSNYWFSRFVYPRSPTIFPLFEDKLYCWSTSLFLAITKTHGRLSLSLIKQKTHPSGGVRARWLADSPLSRLSASPSLLHFGRAVPICGTPLESYSLSISGFPPDDAVRRLPTPEHAISWCLPRLYLRESHISSRLQDFSRNM